MFTSVLLIILLWNNSYYNSWGFHHIVKQPFIIREACTTNRLWVATTTSTTSIKNANEDDEAGDMEGQNLAAEFFKKAKSMGIQNDIDLEDEEDDDDVDSEEEENARDIPVSEVNVFRGIDEGGVGKLAGNVTFTNKELYDSLKERVLESPSTFTSLLSSPNDDDNDEENVVGVGYQPQSSYKPPSTAPDPELTACEVITVILQALLHNDIPEPNTGIKILFSYSSSSSILGNPTKAPTIEQYVDFLKTSEYKIFFDYDGQILVDKMDYSYDKKKAFATIRLKTGKSKRDFTTVNFILSTKGKDDDDVWLIDSMLIRPDGIRRRK